MIRSSRYSLKFITEKKKNLLNQVFDLYNKYLQKTIDLMWAKRIPTRRFMSSKDIDWMDNFPASYKQMIYQQASGIVVGCRRRKGEKHKPIIKNICINFTERDVRIEEGKNSFDLWLDIKLPFRRENSRNLMKVKIPLKEHKHSLKFKDWEKAKTISLSKTYVIIVFKKQTPEPKKNGKVVGVDQGYRNLVTTSEGKFIGEEFHHIYEKIARKQQGSKAFKRSLIERNQLINELLNQWKLKTVKQIAVEDLKSIKKGVKKKKVFRKEFRNKYQRWVYSQVMRKIEMLSEENRVLLKKVDPSYTSQTCPKCHSVHKKNRNGEKFRCIVCGYENHADVTAAINIASRSLNVPMPNVKIGVV